MLELLDLDKQIPEGDLRTGLSRAGDAAGRVPARGPGGRRAGGDRLRGLGRRRQGDDHQPPGAGARSPRLQGPPDQRAHRDRAASTPGCGGSGTICPAPATSPSSTAPGTAACWPSGSKTISPDGDWQRGLRRHPRVRAAVGRRRRGDRQVLAAHRQEGAEAAVQAAAKRPGHGVEGRQAGVAAAPPATTQWLAAVEEMLERTSTANAPWTVVEATHERYARVQGASRRSSQAVEERARPPRGRAAAPSRSRWPSRTDSPTARTRPSSIGST